MTRTSEAGWPDEAAGVAVRSGRVGAAWTLGFLTLVSSFNYLDRSLLGLLLPLIKEDLKLSDTVLGLISGLAFALFYSTLNLPIANLADRYNRRNIIAIGFAFWSAMTALSGLAANSIHLAISRFLMGAGEAACLAPAQSMIADSYSKQRRPLALSIFSTAVAFDALILLPLAAFVAERYGWREAFQLAGVAGILLAALFWITVREPARRSDTNQPAAEPVSLRRSFALLWRIPSFRWIMAGVALMGASLYASGAWIAALLVRVHGLTVSEVGLYVLPARGIIGIVGILAVGWAAERLGRRSARWRYRVPALVVLVLAPGYLALLLSDTPALWIGGILVTGALQTAFQGPIYAVTIDISPSHVKTVAVAVKVFVAGMFGLAMGPLLVGVLSDVLTPRFGDLAIRYAMLGIPLTSLLAGLCFLRAGQLASDC
ncbi:MAG TPA: MFS transporter [Croceibacterium sp.]|nr:MFS transporter [Croceibacterium sp.]